MPFHVQDRSHREREERLDQLASRELASPTLRAIFAQDDALRAIDAAERLLARGYLSTTDNYRISAALNGRSPDEARAVVRARFAREYAAAVAAEDTKALAA